MLFSVYLWTKVPKKRLFGSMRVIAYGLVVSAGLGALTIHNAVADAEEQSLTLGRQLQDLGDLLGSGTEFRLNGQRIYFSNATTDETVSTVLDRFEAHCNHSPAIDPTTWSSLGNVKGKPVDASKDGSRIGVVRKEDPKKGDGMVMCFTSDHPARDLFTALQAFEKSGDLHDLGDVRYVHASPHKIINKKTKTTEMSTLVQTVWTQGSFNVRTLIGPQNVDAVGSDFVTLPRPANSIRRFTAEAVGQPYAARVYESSSTPEQVLADYDAKMGSGNWIGVSSPVPEQQLPEGQLGHWYTRLETGEQAAIAINHDHGKTMVVVGSMGVIEKTPTKQIQ
jgi:hypothetical protein